jgi:hypothetical protein
VDVDGGKKLEKFFYLTSKDDSIHSLTLKIFAALYNPKFWFCFFYDTTVI